MKAFICLSGLPTSLAQALLGNAISQMCDYYTDYSKTQVKQLNSIPGLLLSLSALFFGFFLDRLIYKIQPIVLINLACYVIIGWIPFIFYYNYTATLILRILLGLFAGINEPVTLYMINRLQQNRLINVSFFGYRSSCMSFLSLIINIVSGVIVDRAGFQNLFWFYFIPIIQFILAIFIDFSMLNMNNTQNEKCVQTDDNEQQEVKPQKSVQISSALSTDQENQLSGDSIESQKYQQKQDSLIHYLKELWPVYLTAFLDQLSYYIIPSSTSILLSQLNVTSSTMTGIATGLSQFFNGVVSLFYMEIHNRLSYINLQIISNILTCITMIIFGYSINYAMLLVMISLTSGVFGNTMPNYNSWSGSINKSILNMSIMTFCTFFSHFLTPYVYPFDGEKYNILLAGITQLVWGICLIIYKCVTKVQ